MCDMCYGYIYDTIINELPNGHTLNKYIHRPSLLRYSNEITKCFQKAIEPVDKNSDFFMNTSLYYETVKYIDNLEARDYIKEIFAWEKFCESYPEGAKEMEYLTNFCIDESIVKNTVISEDIIKQFLMNRLFILLLTVPTIHKNHSEPMEIMNIRSPGPVPFKKIHEIRLKLGLPISKWEREHAFDIMIKNDIDRL